MCFFCLNMSLSLFFFQRQNLLIFEYINFQWIYVNKQRNKNNLPFTSYDVDEWDCKIRKNGFKWPVQLNSLCQIFAVFMKGVTLIIYKRILEQTCAKSAVKFIISAHPFCELKMGFDFKNFCLLLLHSNLQMLGLPYLVFPSNPYL